MAETGKDDGSHVVISEQTGEKIRDASAELGEARKPLAVLKSTKKGTDGDGDGDDDPDTAMEGADKDKGVSAAKPGHDTRDGLNGEQVSTMTVVDPRADGAVSAISDNKTEMTMKSQQQQQQHQNQAETIKRMTDESKELARATHLSDPNKSTVFQVTITYDQNTKEDKHVAILFKNFEIMKVKFPKIARAPAGSRRELSLASTHIQPITYTLMNCLLECYKVIEKKVIFDSSGNFFTSITGSQLTDDENQKIVDILSSLNGKTTNPYAYYLSNLTVSRNDKDINFFKEIKDSKFSKKIELDNLIQFLVNFKLNIISFSGVEYPVQKSYFGADGDTTLISKLQKIQIFPDNSPLYPTDKKSDATVAQGGKPQTRKSKLRRRKTERRNSKRGKKMNA